VCAVRAIELDETGAPEEERSSSPDPNARTTPTELRIPLGMTYGAWKRVGTHIALVADSSSWWLGDWIVYGQGQYGKRYLEAIEATQLDYQTLRNYAWVARKFEPPRRRPSLSFQHHLEVAGLPEDDQETWLDRAHIFRWSKSQLRQQLKRARLEPAIPTLAAVDTVTINVESDRRTRWAQAAAAADARDLSAWILDALDDAAARRLS
jgi:hypothetical protein